MPFDALTMAAIADELRATADGGRIQGVFLPAPLAIGLEIYARHATRYLFASAHPQHARVHLTPDKLARGTDDVTPLLLLLRKYVRGGRLLAVEQPPLERTLSLIITKALPVGKRDGERENEDIAPPTAEERSDQAVEISTVKLIIEVMGRYSNIILVNEGGLVLEAAKHIGADINRYRVTLPHHPYVTPPPQQKEDPRGMGAATLQRLLVEDGADQAWQALVRRLRGVSPLAAREAVFRATGNALAGASVVPPAALEHTLGQLLEGLHTHHWSPSVAYEGARVLDFAPYPMLQFGARSRAATGMSAAVHEYFAQETAAADYSGLKHTLRARLGQQRERLRRREDSLQKQMAGEGAADDLRRKGELLLAYQRQVPPRQRSVALDLGPDQPPIQVELDPDLSAVENAQAYFKRYAKARDSLKAIPPLLDEVGLQLAYLEQIALDIDSAADGADLADVRLELDQLERPAPDRQDKRPPRAGRASRALAYTAADGLEILVGRNARQNDDVTFRLAAPDDLWLHARGVPGSHVIVRARGRPAPQATIEEAAAIAAYHSASRAASSVAVDYTLRKYVRKAAGGGPGLATYTHEKTLHARPGLPADHPARTTNKDNEEKKSA